MDEKKKKDELLHICNSYSWLPLLGLKDFKKDPHKQKKNWKRAQCLDAAETLGLQDVINDETIQDKPNVYRHIFQSLLRKENQDIFRYNLDEEKKHISFLPPHLDSEQVLDNFENWFGIPL